MLAKAKDAKAKREVKDAKVKIRTKGTQELQAKVNFATFCFYS